MALEEKEIAQPDSGSKPARGRRAKTAEQKGGEALGKVIAILSPLDQVERGRVIDAATEFLRPRDVAARA